MTSKIKFDAVICSKCEQMTEINNTIDCRGCLTRIQLDEGDDDLIQSIQTIKAKQFTEPLNVRLDKPLLARLNKCVKASGVDRSKLVRGILDKWLTGLKY